MSYYSLQCGTTKVNREMFYLYLTVVFYISLLNKRLAGNSINNFEASVQNERGDCSNLEITMMH